MATAPHIRITSRAFPVAFAVGSTPTSAFDFDGVFWASGDLRVFKDGVLQSPSIYSVTGRYEQDGLTVVGAYGGGRVTFNNPVSNCDIVIDRLVQALRETDYSPTAPLPINSVNSDLDKLTARDQDLLALISSGGGVVSGVSSVNGQVGTVFLLPSDIGAADELHSHEMSQVTGLAAALNLKANLASPTFTGTVIAPTPAASDNTTKVATTAYVQTEIAALGAGVTLATTGTPANLGTANRGVAATAARSDHVHNLPSLAAIGAAADDLTNVATADLRTAILAAGALILHASATPSAAAPNSARANFLVGFDGAGDLTFVDPAGLGGGGVAGVTSVNGASGVVTVSPDNIDAVPEDQHRTLRHFGALNDNGVADNVATFTAFLADADKEVWTGDNADKTLNTTTTLAALAGHRFRGRTKIKLAGDNLPGDFMFLNASPTKGAGSGILYDFSGDLTFGDHSYRIISTLADTPRVRVGLNELYFESTVTPRWQHFAINSGHSGWGAKVNTGCAAGGTQVTLDLTGNHFTYDGVNTVNNFPNGAPVSFWAGQNNDGGSIIHTTTVSSWDPATGILQFADAAPVGGIPTTTTISGTVYDIVASTGKRTHHTANHINVYHNGGGDGGGLTIIGVAGYPGRKGQRHVYNRSTMGLIHGAVSASYDGVLINSFESQHDDDGHDISAYGLIMSFNRTNKTQAYGNRWTGMYFANAGSQPLNNFIYMAGKSDVGIDFSGTDFGAGQRAIAMKEGNRIEFDASQTNGDYGNVRGYSDTAGVTHVSARANGELDARGKRIEFVVNGNLSAAGYGVLNLRGAAVEAHRPVNVYTLAGALAFNLDPTTLGLYLQDGNVGHRRIGNDLHFVVGGASRLAINSAGYISAGGGITAAEFQVSGTKVVGARQAPIADATLDLASVQAQLNALLAAARTHGLIGT